jgi:hypothetical protein
VIVKLREWSRMADELGFLYLDLDAQKIPEPLKNIEVPEQSPVAAERRQLRSTDFAEELISHFDDRIPVC